VVLASGSLHTGPLGWIRRRIVPVGAFLIVTEPLPKETLDRLLPRRRMAVDTKNLVNYFRTTPDNRLLFGGRARFAVSNPNSDEKSGAILQAALHDVFPELRQARIDYCWGGMVEMTRDRLPALQQSLSVGAVRWTHADRLSSRLPTQPESGSRRAFSGSPPRAGGAHQ